MTLAEPMTRTLNELTDAQVAEYHERGFLRIPQVFTPAETAELAEHLDWVIDHWAIKDKGWSGPWRRQYMDEATERKSQLIALHDLHYYSDAWARAVLSRRLAGAMADLLAPTPAVELHHSTLHVKPPESGHPFPMHQDLMFYDHADDRYVDVLVHLDDTRHANGEIRFLEGSHKLGRLEHVTRGDDGKPCSPHLPFEKYRLEDTVPVPAMAGDVVVFNILTVHGSHINTTDRHRRLVRVGYRHPDNEQAGGQSHKRPGWIVWGRRDKGTRQAPYPQGC